MDKRVVLTFIVCMVLSLSIFGLKSCKKACKAPEIVLDEKSAEVDQEVSLLCNAETEEEVSWNFGDGETASGSLVKHKFKKEGEYSITAILTDECTSPSKKITIVSKPVIQPKRIPLVIKYDAKIIEKQETVISNDASGIKDWTWTITETQQSFSNYYFSTAFDKPGTYRIKLAAKGEGIYGDTSIIITVDKAPVVKNATYTPPPPKIKLPPPPPKPSPFLPDGEFKDIFISTANDLLNEAGNASDDWRDKIATQSCGKSIIINVFEGNNLVESIPLERFKKNQLASDVYTVLLVSDIKRGPKNCILQFSATVKKNN